MYIYRIVSRESETDFSPAPGTGTISERRARYFDRALNTCYFRAGDRFRVKWTSKYGVIHKVIDDINEVKWEGETPLFLLVEMDGEMYMTRPSLIKQVRRKK